MESSTRVSAVPGDKESEIETSPVRLDPERVVHYPRQWHHILCGDVVAKTRTLVNVCRRSPQRLESIHNTTNEGREAGKWDCKARQLLRDVDTRWSSVYLMIERYLDLHPVSGRLVRSLVG